MDPNSPVRWVVQAVIAGFPQLIWIAALATRRGRSAKHWFLGTLLWCLASLGCAYAGLTLLVVAFLVRLGSKLETAKTPEEEEARLRDAGGEGAVALVVAFGVWIIVSYGPTLFLLAAKVAERRRLRRVHGRSQVRGRSRGR
jgi:hypothetical protein